MASNRPPSSIVGDEKQVTEWAKQMEMMMEQMSTVKLGMEEAMHSVVQSNREGFLLPSDFPGPSAGDLPESSSIPRALSKREIADTLSQMAKELGEVADESESLRASFSTEQNNEESFDVENEQCSSFQEYVHKRFLYAVNTYSMENLMKIKGIGKTIAKQIIQYREESEDPRPFKCLADLEIFDLTVKGKLDGIFRNFSLHLYNEAGTTVRRGDKKGWYQPSSETEKVAFKIVRPSR